MSDESFNYLQQSGDTSFQLHNPDVDEQGPTPTHIVFLIHGMGYKMFEKNKFRQNMLALSKTVCSSLFEEFQDSGLHLYFYPIEWAAELHGMDTVDERMKKVTLPSIPGMRVFNNDCLADVLFYFTEYHRQRLFNKLGEKINDAFAFLSSKFPDFNGQTGIIGHSLGGVIGYDLLVQPSPPESSDDQLYQMAFPVLERPKLNFEPNFLFTMGCPVAAVMIMRGLRYEHYKLPKSIRFKNIFNPYDPLAYRIEPVMDPLYEKYEPVPLKLSQAPSQGLVPTLRSYLPRPPSALSDISILDSAKSIFSNFNTPAVPNKEASPPPPSPPFSPEAEFDIPPIDIPSQTKRPASVVSMLGFNEARRRSFSLSPKNPSFLSTDPLLALLQDESEEQSKKNKPTTAKANFVNPPQRSASLLAKLALQNNLGNEGTGSGTESDDERSLPDNSDQFSQSLPANLNQGYGPFQKPKSSNKNSSESEPKNEVIGKSSLGQWVESARQLLTTKAEDEQLSWVLGGLTLGLGMFSTKNNMESNSSTSNQNEDEVTQAFNKTNNEESSNSIKLPEEEADMEEDSPNDLERYDYALQIQSIQNLRIEYLLGVRAHFCYWHEKDVGYFLLENFKELKDSSNSELDSKI